MGHIPLTPSESSVRVGATALSVLHAAGIVHRDISSANILFVRGVDGEGKDRGVLMDLEYVTRLDELRDDGFRGTTAFVAQEVWRGELLFPSIRHTWYQSQQYPSALHG